MSCYHPIKAFRTRDGVSFSQLRRDDHVGDIELPCGMCVGCRMRRAQEWTLRIMHEASMHDDSCFVTLTYGRDAMPADGSLDHRDYQLFMKRLRASLEYVKDGVTVRPSVRYYMCGEYGEQKHRPHYHACLFGVGFRSDRKPMGRSESGEDFYSSEALSAVWRHGRCSVQDLTQETAGYCARYIMKKQLGPHAAISQVNEDGVLLRPEYNAMSLKPGIGALWFDKYGSDVLPRDTAVTLHGRQAVPKYYDKLFKRNGGNFDQVEYKRYKLASEHRDDQSPARLAVRERVHEARISSLKRVL